MLASEPVGRSRVTELPCYEYFKKYVFMKYFKNYSDKKLNNLYKINSYRHFMMKDFAEIVAISRQKGSQFLVHVEGNLGHWSNFWGKYFPDKLYPYIYLY